MKTELKNLQHISPTIALRKGTFLDKKSSNFLQKVLTSAKLRKPR